MNPLHVSTKSGLVDVTRLKGIVVDDVAHSLGNICRWNGHTSQHYSVAEHSVRVSLEVERRLAPEVFADVKRKIALAALWHDSPEYLTGDIATPVKRWLMCEHALEILETYVLEEVAIKFQLELDLFNHPLIKEVDRALAGTEARDLFDHATEREAEWGWRLADALPERIIPWQPNLLAKYRFLKRHMELVAG